MALRTMKGPEPLWRVKVVRHKSIPNRAYTGYGCGESSRLLVDAEETVEYYGPYIRRHGAVTVAGTHDGLWDVISSDIETCQPTWEDVN
ncbi:hypothetical protein M2271_003583 [Streptomyces sp. LBL]|uniref:hypothetical protein n=1 Tax=Streptomyces sp. LBL TaxID=2940562 RepID=UPI0024754566|nr:hypothetical protein [Streptomyces sp. LBL]MDH6625772.1 hypothetical protein [Streptomyces sp. LBL]